MEKRGASGRGEPIPSILKKPKPPRGDLVNKSTKIKGEKTSSRKNGDVNHSLSHGCTPLMYACQQADYRTVVDILNKDPSSARVRDRAQRCALHYCAASGAARAAARAACADRVLMAAPALADARDADGLTPLHLAVVHGNVPLVQTLLAAGADVNARDNEQHTVVHWATVCGEVGALRAVLAAGADAATPDQHGGYPLHYAAQMCGAPAATDHQSRGAALEVLRALVREGGASVAVRDADGRTPLLWAASAGSAAAVLALHQAGARVDDADRDGLTALHCAAARGHTEALETLVGLCGARVDMADSHGCTPLHYAAALGHADATSELLEHGADAHRQDRRGRSPAHTAAGARGANLWLRNSKGDLPLHEAVASGRRELVKWLLDGRPSQVNGTNHEGRTPLHIAAASDNADLCRMLLDRGAEVNLVARSSKNEPLTPLDCATSRGHRSTAKYLQMHGGLPASKLSNTEIIIDGASITGLPQRKVTSTKIDVRDRIRIEKKEVVELSSPSLERRRTKERNNDYYTNDSSSDDRKTRKRFEDKQSEKYQTRKKTQLKSQKSFSDGYDSEFEVCHKREKPKYKRRPRSKKSRSKSEPSRRHSKSAKHHRRYRSTSESSSDTDSHEERKKKRTRHKRGRRKTSSSSENSSSESSDRRSTKRKGKKTSIHIEHDDEKQKVNIVKYKNMDYKRSLESNENKVGSSLDVPKTPAETDKELGTIIPKSFSETETDAISVKTNMVVTEAQIHMERESTLNGSSELIVKMDSSNNVAIETSNLSVTHKDLNEDAKTNLENNSDEIVNENEQKIEVDSAKVDEAKDDPPTEVSLTKEEIKEENALKTLDNSTENSQETRDISEDESKPEVLTVISGNQKTELNKEEKQQSLSDVDKNSKSRPSSADKSKETLSGQNSNEESPRKRSFHILSGPDDTSKSDNLPLDKQSIEIVSGDNLGSQDKSSSPSVSFAKKDEIFKINGSDNSSDHLMGEEVEHTEIQVELNEKSGNGASEVNNQEEKRSLYASTTSSSSDVARSVDKSKVKQSRGGTLSVDRAVQQIIMPSGSEEYQENELLPLTSPKQPRKTSRDSQVSSRKSSIYETESYKVLSDATNAVEGILKKSSIMDEGSIEEDKFGTEDKITLLRENFFGRVPSVSDNEIYYSHSEADGRRKRFRKKGRTKSRITIRSKSENSERGYESSGLMDSGFEPSPRPVQRCIMSPRLNAYYQQRNASGKFRGRPDSRIPVRKPGDKNAVDMRTVTQRIQTNMRRYYCERKIFQHLLELKRLQIRTSKTNEAVLVKRAIDEYNKSSLANVGLGPYNNPDYSFSSFEKFLYDSLRKLQKSGKRHLDKLPEKPLDFDYGESELYKMAAIPDNPCLCTSKTHRCFHAVHAYTGIPCSAYIPYKWNHHTMPKPSTAGPSTKSKGFLPKINSKPPTGASKAHVTLEVSHGTEKQLIALPAEKLDKNKRYYVTFTVKGSEPTSDDNAAPSPNNKSIRSG
ncbi:Ankyrin repeat, PH and SEC7 domain containing protein secG [Papilio xuthus]|uniref:Ankyrin repeat, PH and SEC7 domain containing protein secG n=1 Tax=Papilio xuthus TaxID=66420 RepID=A0A194PG92_PAPXU|nr:Ankyrin repeat, PH and SEC7 domain containing protein secG [Papilio xuthus]